MCDPVTLMLGMGVAQAGLSLYSASQQASNASDAYETSQEHAQDNYQRRLVANRKTQEEVNESATVQATDRARRATQEMGALRVAAGELGASGRSSFLLQGDAAYAEGADLRRIERNRKGTVEEIQSDSRAGRLSYMGDSEARYNQAKGMVESSQLNAASSVLRIGSSVYGNYRAGQSATNKV